MINGLPLCKLLWQGERILKPGSSLGLHGQNGTLSGEVSVPVMLPIDSFSGHLQSVLRIFCGVLLVHDNHTLCSSFTIIIKMLLCWVDVLFNMCWEEMKLVVLNVEQQLELSCTVPSPKNSVSCFIMIIMIYSLCY